MDLGNLECPEEDPDIGITIVYPLKVHLHEIFTPVFFIKSTHQAL
jgi:hypothetical protein